jgi:hypothetical protein
MQEKISMKNKNFTSMRALCFLIVAALVSVDARIILSAQQTDNFAVDDGRVPMSGTLFQTNMGKMAQVISCGSGLTIVQGYTMHMQRNDTLLMFVFAIRDAKTMPEVTLLDLYNAAFRGTAALTVFNYIAVEAPNRQGGNSSSTIYCNYVTGQPDSYGNIIGADNTIYLDSGVIFSTPKENQEATINIWENSEDLIWL